MLNREQQIALTGGITAVVGLIDSFQIKQGSVKNCTDVIRKHRDLITEPDLIDSLEIVHKDNRFWRDIKLGKI